MPPVVMFISHSDELSGAEKVMLNLINLHREHGGQATVLCPSGAVSQALPQDLNWVPVPFLGIRDLNGKSGALLARSGATIQKLATTSLGLGALGANWAKTATIIASTYKKLSASGEVVIVCNSLMSLPAVAMAHRLGAAKARWLVHDTLTTGRRAMIARRGISGVGSAVAVSTATADAALAHTGIHAKVAENGCPWPVLSGSALPAVSSTHRVGVIGSLTGWKGHQVLLEAIALLPHTHLDIVGRAFTGDEAYVQSLRDRCEQPDLVGRVQFHGFMDIADALASWDACIVPSIEPDAGPMVVLEALSHQVPVVCSTLAGYAREDYAWLVDTTDNDAATALAAAIEKACQPSELRARKIAAGTEAVAQQFALNKTLPAQLAALLESPSN